MECELKHIKIYYETYGKGKPILMIHGFMPDHRLMKGCMEPIFKNRDNYKRIYFDLPGMGRTLGSKWLENSDQMLEIVLEFINKVIPDETFIIASESYGSYLARGLLLQRPELIDGVLFICPLIVPLPEKRKLPLEHQILRKDNKAISNLSKLEAEEFKESIVVQSPKIWERFRDEVLSGLKIADEDYLMKIFENAYEFSFKVDQLIKKYDKPTLFLLGRQDTTVGYQDAMEIIESYPRASFAILDEAGHNLQIEKENLFMALVEDWLDRIEYSLMEKS
ncbi:MAG: alpha/beta hydrolase [Promethearchaeota archaeon]|nr:MAG: alpha/beta hydrolase [Candidatus Lokiarchaeota archaeon]